MKRDLVNYLNSYILRQSSSLRYIIADAAPSTESELFSASSMIVWSGASDATIYGDAKVNYAFRAIHDAMHLKTGLGFSPAEEIEMGRIQASKIDSDIIAKLFYIEIAGQAEHYLKTGSFVQNQIEFTLNQLAKG